MKQLIPTPVIAVWGRLHRLISARINARPDTEFQQSLIRHGIGIVLFIYFSSKSLLITDEIRQQVFFVLTILFYFGLFVTVTTVLSLKVSPARRYASMLVDFGVLSALLIITGEAGTPLLVVYLWVTLGYGFRYGPGYLITAAGLSVTAFTIVLISSPYWGTHPSISSAFLLSMIAVPLYSVSLLKRLYKAVEREKNANRSKSIFLANMSHELRTPLNGVIGVADLLNETSLNKQQKEYTEIIRSSADTLLELIENVLNISRIEAGRLDMEMKDFDLHRLVNSTILMLENQAKTKNLVLASHVAPQTPFLLHGDSRHLRQILINLIGNAIKFTEYGRVDVYVRPIGQGHPQRVRIEVVDTGIGIPKEAQARIFERFTQADTSVTRRYGGTGLGTTIAKQLVDMMGGQIGVYSREGEGTSFWFEIPFSLQKVKTTSVREELFEKTMRVGILAKNDLTDRLQQIILGWGAVPVVVNNTAHLAAELTAYIAGKEPLSAVVVEKCSLPGEPLEFLRLLHDDPNQSGLPVILIDSSAITGSGSEMRTDTHLIRGGFASVLSVPVNPTLLFNALHAVVSRELPQNVISLAKRFQSKAGTKRPQILVAEDNPVNQRVIKGLLSHAGFEVVIAQDGDEALSILESEERFDLAIIDMHMPELSGPEVIQRWRFMEKGHLPIIMLTADAREDAEEASKAAGADAFLTKPISSHALVEIIANLIENKNQTSQKETATLSPASRCIVDESVLENLALMGGGQPFVRDLIESFNEDSKRSIIEIERAFRSEDFGAWHNHLHMLKGGANDIGAHELARKCIEAERIKPFEIATQVAQDRLVHVKESLIEAQSALATYQDNKLTAESG